MGALERKNIMNCAGHKKNYFLKFFWHVAKTFTEHHFIPYFKLIVCYWLLLNCVKHRQPKSLRNRIYYLLQAETYLQESEVDNKSTLFFEVHRRPFRIRAANLAQKLRAPWNGSKVERTTLFIT